MVQRGKLFPLLCVVKTSQSLRNAVQLFSDISSHDSYESLSDSKEDVRNFGTH